MSRVITSYKSICKLVEICQNDQEIYPLKSLNEIKSLLGDYRINGILSAVGDFSSGNLAINIYSGNLNKLNSIKDNFNNTTTQTIIDTVIAINNIDINLLLSALYNLDSYIDDADGKTTLIDQLNKFTDAWSNDVKDARNKLLESILDLNNYFNPNNPLSNDDISTMVSIVNVISDNVENLYSKLIIFWDQRSLQYDATLLSLIDISRNAIKEFSITTNVYMANRDLYIQTSNSIISTLNTLDKSMMNDKDTEYNNTILFRLNNILNLVSIISNDTPTLLVNNLIDAFNLSLGEWLQHVEGAYNVFEDLRLLYADLRDLMNEKYVSNQSIIDGCIKYIDQANTSYIPNSEWPSYVDIYVITDISVSSHGIGYANGDIAYIPKVGVFALNDVEPTNGSVQTIDPMNDNNHYKKLFYNPLRQEPYMCREAGPNGIGLSVAVNSVYSSPIIRNKIAVPTITFIYQLMNAITVSSLNPNPYENANLSILIQKISGIQDQWGNILSKYDNNMNSNIKDTVNVAVTKLTELAIAGNTLLNIRTRVDVKELLKRFNRAISTIRCYIDDVPWADPMLISAQNDSNVIYKDLQLFYDRGSTWKDANQLSILISQITASVDNYQVLIGKQVDSNKKTEVTGLLSDIISMTSQISIALTDLSNHRLILNELDSEFKLILDPLDYKNISDKSYYQIFDVSVANPGSGYRVGQIVSVLIPDIYVEMGGYYISFEIISIDKEGVASIRPMADYALTENIWGVFNTDNHGLNGMGLQIDIKTKLVQPELFIDVENYFTPYQDQFDDGELMTFRFDNIHDIDLNYEVFIGGKQVTDFYQRHEDTNYLNPRKVDVIYINANKVNNLKNSSLYIPGDHYFVYKINAIEIKDPGTGYHSDHKYMLMLMNIV
jgi:hypothetical protein